MDLGISGRQALVCVAHILHSYAERQQAGILDFQTIVEERQANRRAALGIVGMDSRVDNCFAHSGGWQTPRVSVTRAADLDTMQIVLLHETDCLVDGVRQGAADAQSVDQAHLI
jgi:hypothetical protein